MGCDISESEDIRRLGSFNPRTRMGCDIEEVELLLSINRFNPRTRMGCDLYYFLH